MKKFIYNILLWIDETINHKIVDEIFDHLPVDNPDGSDSIYYKIWKNTFRKYCVWVSMDLYDRWFPEDN